MYEDVKGEKDGDSEGVGAGVLKRRVRECVRQSGYHDDDGNHDGVDNDDDDNDNDDDDHGDASLAVLCLAKLAAKCRAVMFPDAHKGLMGLQRLEDYDNIDSSVGDDNDHDDDDIDNDDDDDDDDDDGGGGGGGGGDEGNMI
ncbi:hypothetical protein ElyMa_005337100 [Elysia marginata]|uniref:Uncharacterized protein n=1 Tax=Elysia marginata TaxID=1093978 RepID=A0AAV4E8V3_9GAST|nr:hypothetical protein ElyMa_005337100 [Elysia marginata]